jgi:hypothetical protein
VPFLLHAPGTLLVTRKTMRPKAVESAGGGRALWDLTLPARGAQSQLAECRSGVHSRTVQPEVALTPVCAECGDVWLPADRDRWNLHLDVDDEVVWLLPRVQRARVRRDLAPKTPRGRLGNLPRILEEGLALHRAPAYSRIGAGLRCFPLPRGSLRFLFSSLEVDSRTAPKLRKGFTRLAGLAPLSRA